MRRALVTTALTATIILTAAAVTPWNPSPPEIPTVLATHPAELPTGPPPNMPDMPDQSPPPSQVDPVLQRVLATIAVALAVAFLVWLTLLVVRRLRDRYLPEPARAVEQPGSGTADLEELATVVQDAAERALAVMDRVRGVPRDAVVAAWLALEDAAATHGARRLASHTPTEFTATVLAATPAPPSDIATLRGLYQRARFSARPVTDDDVDAARDALANIARALDPGTPATTDRPTGPDGSDDGRTTG